MATPLMIGGSRLEPKCLATPLQAYSDGCAYCKQRGATPMAHRLLYASGAPIT